MNLFKRAFKVLCFGVFVCILYKNRTNVARTFFQNHNSTLFDVSSINKTRDFFLQGMESQQASNWLVWLLRGPLFVPGLANLVSEYGNALEGHCVRVLKDHPREVRILVTLLSRMSRGVGVTDRPIACTTNI